MERKLSRVRGFTLMEIVVVLAIIGILAVVATPSFMQMIKQGRISSTANQLHSVFKFARSESAKRQQIINISVSDSEWQVTLDGDSDPMKTFSSNYDSIEVATLIDLVISSTGSVSTADGSTGTTSTAEFFITDNDSSTDDYCLYIYTSGQSELSKEESCS